MQKISEGVLRVDSAQATWTRFADGVVEVEFDGVLTKVTLSTLRRKLADSIRWESAVVFRYEKAVLCCDFSPGHEYFRQPTAEVVSPDQYESAIRFSAGCAESGFMRAVLLPEQIVMARGWAKRNALAAPALSAPAVPA